MAEGPAHPNAAREPGETSPDRRLDASPYAYSSSILPGFVAFLDALAITLSAVVCYFVILKFNSYLFEYYIFATGFVVFAALALFTRADLYEINAIMRPISRSDYVLVSLATAFLFFLTIAFSLKVTDLYSRLWLYSFAGSSFFAIMFARILMYRALRVLSRRRVIGRTLVVLGAGEQGRRFLERIGDVQPYFTATRGVYDQNHADLEDEIAGVPVLGGIEDLVQAARRAEVDDIVVAMPWNADKALTDTIERLKKLPVNVYISSDLVGFQLAFRPALGSFHELPMFEVVQRPISGWSSLLKKAEDFLLAAIALIVLAPLLALVALAIKLDSKGPVFFMQPRLGFNNRRFDIYKFRSMYHEDVPESRVQQATKGDPRVTRVGRFIRATSIDELPQLLNVLNGTMSLVGPRPHALSHNEEFSRQVRGYFARHKVKPGITGWAQVNGLRGETDTPEKIEARVEHDVYYAENWSLAFDIRILIMTVLVVLFQKTAY